MANDGAQPLKKMRRDHLPASFGDEDLALLYCTMIGAKRSSTGIMFQKDCPRPFFPAAALSSQYTGQQDDAGLFLQSCHNMCPQMEEIITGYFERKKYAAKDAPRYGDFLNPWINALSVSWRYDV